MTIQPDTLLCIDLLGGKRPERFQGTAAEIVQAMNQTAFSPTEDNRTYMERFSHYAGEFEGQRIRTESEACFLEDLIAMGLALRVIVCFEA